MATIIDYILPEDEARYKEIIEAAAEVKANTPKKPRGPLTAEQLVARTENRLQKLQEKLAKMRAAAAEPADEADVTE